MKIKEFFKLSWIKLMFLIIIFLLIFYSGLYFIALCDPCPCLRDVGSPFKFLKETAIGANINPGSIEDFSCGARTMNFYLLPLLLDIIFWYLIICVLSFLYKKIKSKKK